MKIGIAASTLPELQPTIDFLQQPSFNHPAHTFEVCITGIGCLAATYRLVDFIRKHKPDCIIQSGIGGKFTGRFSLGEVVKIKEEVMGDLGVEENGGFMDMFDLGLMAASVHPFANKRLINPHMGYWTNIDIPQASGVSVNEITTRKSRARRLQEKYGCEIESMEGAALHYVCLQENIPFIQFRSVSNEVGQRDKSKWQLKEAIHNLNEHLLSMIRKTYMI